MNTLFGTHKSLPVPGQQIIFVKPTRSFFINSNVDQQNLVIGEKYTVRKTLVNSSSTQVWLEEFPNIFDDESGFDQPFFNLSSFSWDPAPSDSFILTI